MGYKLIIDTMLKRGLIEKLVWKYTKYPARAVKEYN